MNSMQKRIKIQIEAKRRAKDAIGPVPSTRVRQDKRFKKPKHKKTTSDEGLEV